MNVTNKKNKQGFTIIEVVLVLAIAALIFLMVFIALPALQRNQRDTQRKNDLGRLQTAINNYQSNNRGRLPATGDWDDFGNDYLTTNGDTFEDPATSSNYQFVENDSASIPIDSGIPGDYGDSNNRNTDAQGDHTIIFYRTDSTCDGESLTDNAGNRKVAFRIKLEGGGTYCVNN